MNIVEYRTHVDALLDRLRVAVGKPGEYAAHYTIAQTPKYLLQSAAGNKMRQFDGDYMNDPEEGRYVVDVMIAAAQACTHQYKSSFVERFTKLRESRLLYSAYRKATFLSCWTITYIKPGFEDSSDSLNHWRFYGDDGKGSCLMVPLANLLPIFPNQLFHVTYGTESRGGGATAAERPIRQLKDGLTTRLNAIRRSYGNAMEDLEEVIQATHPLLFLFKSSEYAAEREVRSIVHKPDYAAASGVLFDQREPKRAYIDGNPGLVSNNSILYFGPKADHKHAIEVMGLSANLGVELRVFVSSMPYR
ncbi:hypothetical protein [Aquabacterium sp.]|uniref:hypothetical protein n=1 Tax=Aquabacterium sp. TaxID=1872578 RepID=UPI003D6C980F